MRGDRLAWAAGFGFADLQAGTRPDERTLYRVASITKTFTATAILQLRDEGRLRLDDPLVMHVPEFAAATNPFGPIADVTIRRLLMHRSGLQGERPFADARRYPLMSPDELLGMLDRVVVSIPPDSAHKYSNLGYELLGEVVRRISGMSTPAYLAANITGPLGMASTTLHPSGPLLGRCAVGYDAHLYEDRLPAARTTDSAATQGDAGLWSSVEDLGRWVSQQFRCDDDRRRGAGQVLDGATLREMRRAAALNDATWTEAQGLGWYTTRADGVSWVEHSGGWFGYTTNVSFEPEAELGAIVLLNGIGPAARLARQLAAEVLPAQRDARAAARLPATPPEPTPEAWVELVGSYREVETAWEVRVECRGRNLVCIVPEVAEEPHRLEPTADALVYLIHGGRHSGEAALFLRGTDGRVDGLNLGGNPLVRLDQRQPA